MIDGIIKLMEQTGAESIRTKFEASCKGKTYHVDITVYEKDTIREAPKEDK